MLAQSQGAWPSDTGDCRWRLWAPCTTEVDLVLWEDERLRHVPLRREAEGYFGRTLSGIVEGQRYAYQLDGAAIRPDPASRWQPAGVHAASAVWSPDSFTWTDAGWKGIRRADLVIYELHVGAFTPGGTFDDIVSRLKDLVELGVTAVEIMPIGQFPGARDWGYDGAYWFAVQSTYGGPSGLQRLVDACHAHGLSVILDVVYNHLGPEGNYLREFGPYFTDRYSTPWGQAVNFDGPASEHVRRMILDNVRYWVRDFHIDGLRLDAIHSIHDAGPVHILAEIQQAANEVALVSGRVVHVIAESDLNDVVVINPPEQRGYGLDAQWSDDFHHCVHTLLTREQDGYYADFDDPPRQLAKALSDVFVYDGDISRVRRRPHGRPIGDHSGDRFVISVQNHDQVGNRALGERLSQLTSPAQQRLAAGLLLLSPQIPLLFMGEEYGELRPFPFFCDFGDRDVQDGVRRGRRDEFAEFAWQSEIPDPLAVETFGSAQLAWSWPAGTSHEGLRRLYRDLLLLRRLQPALHDYRHRSAIIVEEAPGELLVLRRGDPRMTGHRLQAVFNLGEIPQRVGAAPWPECSWLLRSERRCYGGDRPDDQEGPELLGWEFAVFAARPERQGDLA